MEPMHTLPSPEMQGRHVLVTGAGSGIGLATARVLLGQGARVAAVVQTAAQAEAVRGPLAGAAVLLQDLRDDAGVATLPARAAEAIGGLDGLAGCAGIFFNKGSDDTTLDEWRDTLDLNLTATFVLTRAAIAHMRQLRTDRAHDASVVVVTSQIGLVGFARGAAYAASKAGLNGMVKSLALEWAAEGLRVNAVGPGPVETAMVASTLADPQALAAMHQSIPMGRLGQPAEIGELISFLLSRRASFITGQVVCADGGFTAR
jgi:NAD(P)-dependent dehydrogenase (short-subunit alcohol dehydrogenase family)